MAAFVGGLRPLSGSESRLAGCWLPSNLFYSAFVWLFCRYMLLTIFPTSPRIPPAVCCLRPGMSEYWNLKQQMLESLHNIGTTGGKL